MRVTSIPIRWLLPSLEGRLFCWHLLHKTKLVYAKATAVQNVKKQKEKKIMINMNCHTSHHSKEESVCL
jgi:hypothetical protein